MAGSAHWPQSWWAMSTGLVRQTRARACRTGGGDASDRPVARDRYVCIGSSTAGRWRRLSSGSTWASAFRRWDRAPDRRWPTHGRHSLLAEADFCASASDRLDEPTGLKQLRRQVAGVHSGRRVVEQYTSQDSRRARCPLPSSGFTLTHRDSPPPTRAHQAMHRITHDRAMTAWSRAPGMEAIATEKRYGLHPVPRDRSLPP